MGIYDQRFRDISASLDGLSAYGNLDLWKGAYLDYNIYGGIVELQEDGGVAGLALTSASRVADNLKVEFIDSKYNYGGQLWLSPGLDGLRMGFSVTQFMDMSATTLGTVPLDAQPSYLAGLPFRSEFEDYDLVNTTASIEYFVGEWNFVGEYLYSDVSLFVISDIAGVFTTREDTRIKGDSFYLSAARRFDRLEASVTYVEYYENRDNRKGIGTLNPSSAYNKDLQFSIRYDVTDYWSLKAEIHDIKGTARLFNELQQNPILDEEAWTLFAAKSTFSF
ncbi:hypothetical protein QEH53_14535 [Pelagicoccus sp. SDUM812002]|nr:hypothetical protein [Pelagicoccus sp. SDUM812002]